MATNAQVESLKRALSYDCPLFCSGTVFPPPEGFYLYYGKEDPRCRQCRTHCLTARLLSHSLQPPRVFNYFDCHIIVQKITWGVMSNGSIRSKCEFWRGGVETMSDYP